MQHDEEIVNPTGARSLMDIVEQTDLTRRKVMVGGLGSAALTFFGGNKAVTGLKAAGAARSAARHCGAFVRWRSPTAATSIPPFQLIINGTG